MASAGVPRDNQLLCEFTCTRCSAEARLWMPSLPEPGGGGGTGSRAHAVVAPRLQSVAPRGVCQVLMLFSCHAAWNPSLCVLPSEIKCCAW